MKQVLTLLQDNLLFLFLKKNNEKKLIKIIILKLNSLKNFVRLSSVYSLKSMATKSNCANKIFK